MKFLILLFLTLLSIQTYALEKFYVGYTQKSFPKSLDIFSMQPLKAKFIGIHDPGYITFELFTGDVIDTTYKDDENNLNFEILYEWEKNDKKNGHYRGMNLTYNNKEGVIITDNETNTKFYLTGEISQHPINFASVECEDKYSGYSGITSCRQLELQAWDAELNRVYKEYGGSSNLKLKLAQRAWIKYKEAQIEFLRETYLNRGGAIWPRVYLNHVISITRNQVKLLKLVKEW